MRDVPLPLPQYVAMFEWSYNLKRVTDPFLALLIGPATDLGA
jgi:hypothetical protein